MTKSEQIVFVDEDGTPTGGGAEIGISYGEHEATLGVLLLYFATCG
jgi:hypothetical protein